MNLTKNAIMSEFNQEAMPEKGEQIVVMKTSEGTIKIRLFPELAPKTVENFAKLVGDGFYDGLKFHRVIANFMIQTGCPDGNGSGGPGYNFDDELYGWL